LFKPQIIKVGLIHQVVGLYSEQLFSRGTYSPEVLAGLQNKLVMYLQNGLKVGGKMKLTLREPLDQAQASSLVLPTPERNRLWFDTETGRLV